LAADIIEFDVRLIRDGAVVIHDVKTNSEAIEDRPT
jgi:glycerophosphoryl diester phosphodiesterase